MYVRETMLIIYIRSYMIMRKSRVIYACQALTHAIHIRERSAKSAGISLPPIDSVETKLLHVQILVKVDVVTLRGQRQFVLAGIFLWVGTQEVGLVYRRLAVEEPNSVALHGIDGESVKVGSNVERFLQLKVGQGTEIFVFPDRADHGSNKLELFRETCPIILLSEQNIWSEDGASTIDESLSGVGEGVGRFQRFIIDFSNQGRAGLKRCGCRRCREGRARAGQQCDRENGKQMSCRGHCVCLIYCAVSCIDLWWWLGQRWSGKMVVVRQEM